MESTYKPPSIGTLVGGWVGYVCMKICDLHLTRLNLARRNFFVLVFFAPSVSTLGFDSSRGFGDGCCRSVGTGTSALGWRESDGVVAWREESNKKNTRNRRDGEITPNPDKFSKRVLSADGENVDRY